MTQFEFECPNKHSVKFTLEMCGRTAQCPKCSARFEVPKLEEVREMLGDEIDEDLEKEFKIAEIKLREFAKAKAAKRALLEKEAKEKAEKEAQEKAEKEAAEKAEQEAKEKARKEAAEKAEKEAKEKARKEAAAKAEKEVKEKAEKEAKEKAEQEAQKEEKEENEEGEMISFLCPNGHELSAPVTAAGKKGRCPECNAKFIVPTVESVEEAAQETNSEEELELELSLDDETGPQTQEDDEKSDPEIEIEIEAGSPEHRISVSKDSNERPFLYPNLAIGTSGKIDLGLDEAIRSIPEALKMDPMAKFFWTLWTSVPEEKTETQDETPKSETESSTKSEKTDEETKDAETQKDSETVKNAEAPKTPQNNIIGKSLKSAQAGKIEIQTADSQKFTPLEFYEDKSLSPIGYFEALDENGNPVTLVIRWENVVRIVVKK